MSTVEADTDPVEAEIVAAMNETPDDEEPEPDEDEEGELIAATAPAEPLSEKQVEQVFRRATSESQRHAKRLAEIIGEDWTEFDTCPMCDPVFSGFLNPAAKLTASYSAAMIALGHNDRVEYAPATDAVICDRCHGLGEVLTGSLRPEQRLKLCTFCSGAGWQNQVQQVASRQPEPAYVFTPTPNTSTQGTAPQGKILPAFDFANRPLGHPDYGRLDAYLSDL